MDAVADEVVGPPVPRALNDVGGLLDTSKGWTLSIPGPGDGDSAAAKLIASQQGKAAAIGAPSTGIAGPAVASR
jgi:hypothetical protein